ncbi:MAG: hypothetical protein FD141_1262 [Fusobacteria bacterium]|nr:MAG: hypothetical protein FD141_1262 [Fusobacteriota bacterium]KAF0229975.1 MAG: hypothetical protein FD182_365 [Fusobacteriota bacterium]
MRLNIFVYNILALAIVYILFLLFKGPTNILNALFVPLTLLIFSFKSNFKERMVFYGTVILFTALFFSVQVFFVIAYCFIAAILRVILVNKFRALGSLLLLTLSVGFLFYLGIVLTDLVFLTRINSIMMNVLNNNVFVYAMVIIVEAGFVSVLLFWFSKLFMRRIRLNKGLDHQKY